MADSIPDQDRALTEVVHVTPAMIEAGEHITGEYIEAGPSALEPLLSQFFVLELTDLDQAWTGMSLGRVVKTVAGLLCEGRGPDEIQLLRQKLEEVCQEYEIG